MTTKIFTGGIPYGPDIRKLEERVGVPTPGTLVTYTEIEMALGYSWRTPRFRGVVWAWRKKLMREANLDTFAEPASGIRVLTAEERVDVTCGDVKASARKVRRVAIRAESISVLEIKNAKKRDEALLVRRISRAMYESAANEIKALAPPPAPKSLPTRAAAPAETNAAVGA
jgi:hypothetical protein